LAGKIVSRILGLLQQYLPLATDIVLQQNVGFSNRPFRVKRFQTIRRYSVDVAHGLVLLFGIGTRAVPLWGSKTRWNNLSDDLAVRRTTDPSRHARRRF
jgi:hypothetical protein